MENCAAQSACSVFDTGNGCKRVKYPESRGSGDKDSLDLPRPGRLCTQDPETAVDRFKASQQTGILGLFHPFSNLLSLCLAATKEKLVYPDLVQTLVLLLKQNS